VDARPWLERLERQLATAPVDEAFAPLAFLASQGVSLPRDELRGAQRRALLLRAAGGDPRRPLAFEERAVSTLAENLDRPERRGELNAGLGRLAEQAVGLKTVSRAAEVLRADSELAWRWLACSLLAEELSESEG
jgi:hypothetical protein